MKLDKTTALLLSLLGVAAVLVCGLLINIADRSARDVQEIKAVKIKSSVDGFSAVPSLVEDNNNIGQYVTRHLNDGKIALTEIEFTQKSFAELARLHNLSTLKLRGCSFENAWLQYLLGLPNLRYLDMDETTINAQGLARLSKMQQLTDLNLRETAVSDEDMDNLPPNLIWLGLSNTKISDKGVMRLAKYSKLRELNLGRDAVTDQSALTLSRMTKLRVLDLTNTQITDATLAQIARLPDLKVLGLINTQITDQGLRRLYGLKKLRRVLILGCPKLTKEDQQRLQKALPLCDIVSTPKRSDD